MDDDPQPRIAILGAGPIGLEAALYARYLGYSAEVFEQEKFPAQHVQAAEDQMLDAPFCDHASSLGVAALMAQDSDWQSPAGSAMLSAVEYHHQYLRPLAESDLIAESLRLDLKVVSVDRSEENTWRIICQSLEGHRFEFKADCIIDTTGAGSEMFVQDDGQATESLSFLNPTADYYVLGSKSSESGEEFRFTMGLSQIRELFAILGERENLDIYATMPPIAG